MISFEEYVKTYHKNIAKNPESYEYNFIANEFDKVSKKIEELDRTKCYESSELKSILFSGSEIKSLTPFYSIRRMCERIMICESFDYRVIRELNNIEYEDVMLDEDMHKEYFSDIDDLLDSVEKIRRDFPGIDRFDSEVLVGLIFNGITSSRIPELRVGDISKSNNTIRVDGVDYHIDDRTFELLSKFVSGKKGNELVFVGRYGKFHFTAPNKMLKSLNDTQDDRKYVAKSIYNSGVFYRMYHNIENASLRSDRKIKYLKWVDTFGNN